MIVMKFGGTSNQDASAMTNVIRIVKAHLQLQPVVVISAIANSTNELEETARVAARGDENGASAIVTRLFERHNKIIDNLIHSRLVARDLEGVFYQHLTEIKELVKGVAILRELTPRTMDTICSYGERLSSRIIAAGLKEAGVDSVWVDAKEFMITDDNFGCARPLMDKVATNLHSKVRPILQGGKTPVTQGFIGVTSGGAYTTLGRESSDYSAAIIGAAMDAVKVQIWTDVDGVLTADPRIVDSTKKLNRLTFEEAFELSYFGAKVLHPSTMLPLIEKNIPVQILNSRSEGTGTFVDIYADTGHDDVLKSVVYKRNLAIITVTPKQRFGQFVFWENIFSVLTQTGSTTGMMATSEYSIAFTVDSTVDPVNLVHKLEQFGKVEIVQGKASLCLVGKGLRGRSSVSNRIFDCLSDLHIYMISYGASELNMAIVIDEEKIPDAVGRLHREFFETGTLSETFESLPK